MAYAIGDVYTKAHYPTQTYSVAPITSYPDSANGSMLQSPVTYSNDDTSVDVYDNHHRRFLERGMSVGGSIDAIGASGVSAQVLPY